ncbi:hypothetical protein RKD19_007253 [Streptomyces canus]
MAPSGAGKSSLLNAGLVPALRAGALPMAGAREWPVAVLTPTPVPLEELLSRTSEALGVLPREVGDAAGGWLALERGVSAVVIVGVQPVGERCASFLL